MLHISNKDDVKKLGTILGIWAHPDDETWAAAGVMALAAKNGQRVVCVTATRGDAGKTANQKRWPQAELSQIREQELKAALDIIGCSEQYFLGHQDGKLAEADVEKAITEIAELIKKIDPDTILTFEPKGITGHVDHQTISSWTKEAVQKSKSHATVYGACETEERYNSIGKYSNKVFNFYFNTDKPFTVNEKDSDMLLVLNKQLANKKLEALRAHASQTYFVFKVPLGKQFYAKLAQVECFIKLS